MSDIPETGLVKMKAANLANKISEARSQWEDAREREGEYLIEYYIKQSAQPRWFGLVKPTPRTREQALEYVKQQYRDDYRNSWNGYMIRQHMKFLDNLTQMTDIALGPAGDGFVYLSGEQISKLRTEPMIREQEEN